MMIAHSLVLKLCKRLYEEGEITGQQYEEMKRKHGEKEK